jgi:dihydrofolate reductase
MKKYIIAAVADNYAIGKNNQIPWHIKEDLEYFKTMTSGHPVIMGRNTYESIGKPLPGRTNIVLTHKYLEDVICVESLEDAFKEAEKVDNECFIIGGASLYKECINDADTLYITHIHTVIEDADTFFPMIDGLKWIMIYSSDIHTDDKSGLKYNFEEYTRKELWDTSKTSS